MQLKVFFNSGIFLIFIIGFLVYLWKFSSLEIFSILREKILLQKLPAEKKEIIKLADLPKTYQGPLTFGVQKSEEVSNEYYLSGWVTAKAEDWIEINTGKKTFRLFKREKTICFAEEPTPSLEVKGKEVDCLSDEVKVNSWGLATIKLEEGKERIIFSFLRFIKPELIPK